MQTLEPGQDEQAKVNGWRLHVLIEAGYPVDVAERIADSDADLHDAVELLEQGCAARRRRADPPLGLAAIRARQATLGPRWARVRS